MPLSQDDTTVHCRLEWTDADGGGRTCLCPVALTILKRAGATGIHLQKPSHGKKGEAWPVGLGMTPSLLSLLSRRRRRPPPPPPWKILPFLAQSVDLLCFALVRPSHLYLGVARQKRGARFDFGWDRSGRSSFVKSEGGTLENFERLREGNGRTPLVTSERRLRLRLEEKGFILFTGGHPFNAF